MPDILSDKISGSPRAAAQKRPTSNASTAGATPRNFCAAWPQKSGSLRPICRILRSDFRRGSACKSLTINSVDRGPGEESGEEEAEVCSSYVLHIALLLPSRVWYRILRGTRARQRTKSRSGLERPRHHFGRGIVCKSGVAPAQHGVLRASKLIVAPCATSCPLGTCSISKVTARVTDMVVCVFHAPVTLPRYK